MPAPTDRLAGIRAYVSRTTSEGVCPVPWGGCGAALDRGRPHIEACPIGMLAWLLERETKMAAVVEGARLFAARGFCADCRAAINNDEGRECPAHLQLRAALAAVEGEGHVQGE